MCFANLLNSSFKEQKFFILMKLIISILSFMDHVFGVVSEKVIAKPKVTQIFSYKIFYDFCSLHFTFRSVIHFELLFVKGVRSVSRLVFLHLDVQLFQHHLKRYLCSIVLPLLLCQRSVTIWIYFQTLFSSIDPFVYSFTNPTVS